MYHGGVLTLTHPEGYEGEDFIDIGLVLSESEMAELEELEREVVEQEEAEEEEEEEEMIDMAI